RAGSWASVWFRNSRGSGFHAHRRTERLSFAQLRWVDHRHEWNGDDELRAPADDVVHLADNLVLEVPWQDEDVVRLCLVDRIDRLDRDMHAWCEAAVFVGIAIDREVEEIGADGAIIEQRVALSRRAVTADLLAFALCRDQEGQEVTLCAARLVAEGF